MLLERIRVCMTYYYKVVCFDMVWNMQCVIIR